MTAPKPTPPKPGPPRPAPPRSAPPRPQTSHPGAESVSDGTGAAPVRPDSNPEQWGRVAEDGTVYVRTADGERSVGQYPEGTPAEALAFYANRFDALAFEVTLLEQRVAAGSLSPDQASESIAAVAQQVDDAHAVGDLVGLHTRLEALRPLLAAQRETRRKDKARRLAQAKERKSAIAADAERIATGKDWRGGVGRLRDLLEEWKLLPRIDKATDDELWHRFSAARTAYTKARKAHFAQLNEGREAAGVIKARLAKEAEALAGSTEWGPTSGRYRDLMREWKAAGAAPREVEEELWGRFRGAQDQFFAARDAANAAQDSEFAANAEVKRAILLEAEALLPVTDLAAAKRAFRDLAERWEEAGKVPRDQIKSLEARIRKVEQEIRSVEDNQWRRSDPEKSARADGMIGQLHQAIEDLERDLAAARESGNDRAVAGLEETLASRRAFLEMAEKAAADFSG